MSLIEIPNVEVALTAGAATVIVLALAFDLGIWRKKSPVFSVKQAAIWSIVWIALALFYNLLIYLFIGKDQALQFLSGYLVEKSLSIDNLFIFLIIFNYFRIPKEYQPKVLFWGFAGAIIFRVIMIGGGLFLLDRFLWLTVLLGIFLIFTGLKTMFHSDNEEIKLEDKIVLKLARKFLPVTSDFHGNRFFIRKDGRWMVTPLLLVLILLETTDVLFAVDSVPAILGISQDPLILITSNAFAILGLRALYFVLNGMFEAFKYLKQGVSLVLIYVGCEMAFAKYYHPSEGVTLAVIGAILTASIGASMLSRTKESPQ